MLGEPGTLTSKNCLLTKGIFFCCCLNRFQNEKKRKSPKKKTLTTVPFSVSSTGAETTVAVGETLARENVPSSEPPTTPENYIPQHFSTSAKIQGCYSLSQ